MIDYEQFRVTLVEIHKIKLKFMKIELIPDIELDSLEKEDKLGTLPYVNTLHEVVKNCDTPFNIGLIAGWGGGKSSIIETLIKRIKDENKVKKSDDIVVFKYDAWKYSEDPFRRTFLIRLMKKFNIEGNEKLENLLYENTSAEQPGKTKISLWKIFLYAMSFPMFVLIVLSLSDFNPIVITALTSSSFVAGLITFVLKEMFTTYKVTIQKNKIVEPEKFETIFEEAVDTILKRERSIWKWLKINVGYEKPSKEKKLLIIIDNIDRCNESMVVQLLLTVKNFLDKKGVIFILPVDETGLTFFLKNTNQNATEFLRKIFNSTIRIKHYSNDEMFDFSWRLVEKHNLASDGITRDVVHIACQEYTKNPRKIIQFLNNFQMEIFLVKEQEKNNYLKDNHVSSNFPFLAKLAIVRDEWPELYHKLFEKNHLLKDIHNAISNNQYVERTEKKYHVAEQSEMPELDEKQYTFFRRTMGITVQGNIEPFFVNRDLMKGIPDSVIELIAGADWDKLKKYIEDGELNFLKLLEAVKKKFDADIHQRKLYSTTGNAIFRLISQIVKDEKYSSEYSEEFSKNTDNKYVISLIDYIEFDSELRKISQDDIMPMAKWLLNKGVINLKEKVVNIINAESFNSNEKAHFDFTKSFTATFSKDEDSLKSVSIRFSTLLSANPTWLNEVDEILNEKGMCEILFTQDFVNEQIGKINAQTAVSQPEKSKLFNSLKGYNLLNDDQINSIVNSFSEHLNSNMEWPYMTSHFNALKPFVGVLKDPTTANNLKNVLDGKHNHFVGQLGSGNINQETNLCYESYIDVLYELITSGTLDNDVLVDRIYTIGLTNHNQEMIRMSSLVLEKISKNKNIPVDLLRFLIPCANYEAEIKRKEELILVCAYELNKRENHDVNYLNSLFDLALSLYFSNASHYETFMIDFLNLTCKKEVSRAQVTSKLNSNPNIEHKKLVLKVADRVEHPEIVGGIANDIVLSSKDINVFIPNIEFIIQNYTRGMEVVKQELISALKNSEAGNLNVIIDLVVSSNERMKVGQMDLEVIDTAISRLKGHLISKDTADIDYAFEKLNAIAVSEVTDSTKKLMASLIAAVDVPLNEIATTAKEELLKKYT
jgi:hypothetical protein